MNKKLNNYILSILVILLPWHAFFVTALSKFFLNSDANYIPITSLLIASWKETLILILGVGFIAKWISEKKFPIKRIYLFDKIFVVFLAIALSSWIFFTDSFIQGLWGLRLDFIYFLLFYLIRGIDLEKGVSLKIFNKFCISAFFSLIFGLCLYSFSFNHVPTMVNFENENYDSLSEEKKEFLKSYYNNKGELVVKNQTLEEFFSHHEQIDFRNENYLNLLTSLGYSENISSYNPQKPLAAFHFIEARGTARFAGTFSGPNQIGFFLIVLISFVFSLFVQKTKVSLIHSLISKIHVTHKLNSLKKGIISKIDKKFFLFLLIVISLIALYFTYSRSSWIGFIASIGVFSLLTIPKHMRVKILFIGLISTFLLSIVVYNINGDFLNRTLIRKGSSTVHFEKSLNAAKQVYSNPLGLGLGMAGPVTIRFSPWDKQNIAENWFIQMFQEFGIHGGLVYISFLISLLIFLYKKKDQNFLIKGSLISLIGLLIAGMFLHSFEDMPTSLILFCFLGLGFKDIRA